MAQIHHGLTRTLLSTLLLLQPVLAVPGQGTLVPRASQSSVSTSSTTPSISSLAATCNGHSEYCTRAYSNLTFIGAHDSPFVGPLPQQNQNIDIKAQLDMGIRYLQAQSHRSIIDENVIELCHTSCLLEDGGPLKSFLTTIKDWLDANPNEVVTLLLTNGDSLSANEFGDTFSSSGIAEYAYVPPHYGADTKKVNYIQDEFAYYFETAYDVTDPAFSNCSIDRPSGAAATGRMGIINHFLDVDILGIKIPARHLADTTNAATGPGSIGEQATLCTGLYGRAPNVILADFVDKGDVITAQKNLNGL
ncbi:uncharacterized protein N7500_003625 [Penicillium coprophilum]|uniref:uncharacterized protein n=1 Tax=Penicillium coprophilum TaxID=36646 RepID=UPI002387F465|nr:uncharacterized protein N7500_003625 [Penicillium coprophilum]KAJ5170842.1 hypothetical protein N7500_003625 [Penicillium coprophilum]